MKKIKLATFGRLISVFLGLASGVVLLLGVIGSIAEGDYSYTPRVLLIVASLLVVCAIACLGWLFSKFSGRSFRVALSAMVLVNLATVLVVYFAVVSRNIGWDPGLLFWAASEHVDGSYLGGQYAQQYLAQYGNNIFISMTIIAIAKLSSALGVDMHIMAAAINALLVFLSSLAILYVSCSLSGRRGLAAAWVLSLSLVITSPWIGVFYTDTVGLFFISYILVAITALRTNGRWTSIWFVLLGLLGAIGFLVKPTVMIVIIAFAVASILGLIVKKEKPSRSSLVGSGLSAVIFMLVIGGFNNFIQNRVIVDDVLVDRFQLSMDHFLAVGSLRGLPPYEECRLGGYCDNLVKDVTTRGDLDTKIERHTYYVGLLRDSVMTGLPFEYLSFITGKVMRSFGDGSFFVWREGNSIPEYIYSNKSADFFREFLGKEGEYREEVNYLRQVFWLSSLVLIIVFIIGALLFGPSLRVSAFWFTAFTVAVVGIALYQIFFESRSRYIFLYLPLFIAFASCGLPSLEEINKRLAIYLKRRRSLK